MGSATIKNSHPTLSCLKYFVGTVQKRAPTRVCGESSYVSRDTSSLKVAHFLFNQNIMFIVGSAFGTSV